VTKHTAAAAAAAATSSFMALCPGLPKVSRYHKKHSPTNIYPDHQSSFISFLPPSTAIRSILPVQFTCLTVFLHKLSPSPIWSLGLEPSTSCSIHFFTQSLSSLHNKCPYHRNLFCCSAEITSSNSSLYLNSLPGTF